MQTKKLKVKEVGRVVFRDEELFNELRGQATLEGYRSAEEFIRMLLGNRKIYQELIGRKVI